MRVKSLYATLLALSLTSCILGQEVDGTLGKQLPIDLSHSGSLPYAAEIGDIFAIQLSAKDVKKVVTEVVPDQGDAAKRVALVRVGETIVAYYSADKVGTAQVLFEISRSSGGTTTIDRKIISLKVSEAQDFNTVHECDLDASPSPQAQLKIGDVLKIRKQTAGLTSLKCSSLNSSIVRRDAVFIDGNAYVYLFTVVGRGSTTVAASWGSPGKDGGFILAITAN